MPPNHGQVSALVSLISNAAKILESQFDKSTIPYIPSLEDTTPHPLDSEIISKELQNAIQIIEGACAQLSATIARPSHVMVNKFMNIYEPQCLRVALEFKIADILLEKPEGMHITELGQKANIDARKVGRILRFLSTKHCFREVSRDVFANNRLSMQLLSSNPLWDLGLHFTNENARSTIYLSDTLASPEWGRSYKANHTCFNKWSGHSGTLFDWFEGATPEGAEQGARFGIGMVGWGAAIGANAVIHQFPWAELGDGASVCDVGGGVGNITMQLARTHPTLQLKLQDTPERVRQAEFEVWPQECPEALKENRIEFKAIDFLTESPIKGCNVYYLKNIIHDWPDDECVMILKNIAKVMAPHSCILIHEYVLQHLNRIQEGESEFRQAPEPLLVNFGAGRIRPYALDLDMMVMLNSEERTISDFVALGRLAGLKFEKLWECGEMSVVELRLP